MLPFTATFGRTEVAHADMGLVDELLQVVFGYGSAPATKKRQTASRRRTTSRRATTRSRLSSPRAFISFEKEDSWARDLLVGQARNRNNEIQFVDYSLHEPFGEKWKTNCRTRIARTRGTVVLVGPTTSRSQAVAWEIAESVRQGHPVFGIQINRDRTYAVPPGLPASRVIRWDVDAIVRRLSRWT